ncbi:MAG: hypothetical protein KIG16_00075 [Eubacteriales bacterium]|nr:hypothetical protein [Eubacteriales bacterium]
MTTEQKDFRPWVVYVVCLGVALVFMFFFGLNSPLHTFNSHCDYQWYMTMGRGMASGKVIYRDLFDHKGPIVYTMFAFACLFPNPQFVIWCIEVLCVSWFLDYCYRIARKFLSPWLSLLIVPLMMMALSSNYVRGIEGSCVEEYCLPVFAYALLCFLEFLLDRKPATWRRSLTLGVLMGVLFWTKYTMLEFFIIPLLIWVVVQIVEHKFLVVVRSGFIMLGGFVLVTLPVIVVFAALGALDDLWQVYFMVNLGSYTGDYENGVEVSYQNPWSNFGQSFLLCAYFGVLLLFGVVCFAVAHWRQKSGWLLLIAVLPTWLLVGFICGYVYYYLPLYAYLTLGMVYVVKLIAQMLQKADIKIQRTRAKVIGLIVTMVLSCLTAIPFVENISEINRPREVYAPLQVADIIAEYNQTAAQPATLFCYRMGDGGFYNAAGIVPNVKYYAQSSFTETSFPEMFASFDQTIAEQRCDFVVTYRATFERNQEFLLTYYHPYFNNDLDASSISYDFYEPGDYYYNTIVILYRN